MIFAGSVTRVGKTGNEMLRIYLNNFEESPLIWSVDRGSKATEQRFKQIFFSNAAGKTQINLQANNVDEPKCWIQVIGEMRVVGQCAIVGKSADKLSKAIMKEVRMRNEHEA